MFDALYIGRFQPFHNGHLHALKSILEDNEDVLIAIGSSEKSFEPMNPLRFEEREEIIEGVLKAEDISLSRCMILPVRDINDNDAWVAHVESCLPQFDRVYSGTELVQELFKRDGKHEVLDVSFYEGHSGTLVRQLALDSKDYRDFIHPFTKHYLERIGFDERLLPMTGDR
jgi:nicotinamide-nucleotide adenylyltransferase